MVDMKLTMHNFITCYAWLITDELNFWKNFSPYVATCALTTLRDLLTKDCTELALATWL